MVLVPHHFLEIRVFTFHCANVDLILDVLLLQLVQLIHHFQHLRLLLDCLVTVQHLLRSLLRDNPLD